MSDIELLVDPSPVAADLRLGECSSLEEFEDEVQALLRHASPNGDPVVILFHPGARAPVTVPEAVGALVAAHGAAAKRVSVRCLFASERAKQSAERLIPGLVRPDRWASFGALQVVVVQGDIVSVAAEAIVNTSNVRLELGAGVSGAIKRAVVRPDALQAEMRARAPIEPGEVVATSAHGLGSVRFILHAATASGGEHAVSRAYTELLELAEHMHLKSVAVPSLGSGTGGLAPVRSAELLRKALKARAEWRSLRRLTCVLYDGGTADTFAAVLSAEPRG